MSLFIVFHCLTIVQVPFCSLIKGITPKMCMLCFVRTNSVLLNLLCVWILISYMRSWSLQSLSSKTWQSLWQFNLTHAWQMLQLKISAWQPLGQHVEQSACAFSLQSKWTTTQSDQLGAAIKQEQRDWSRHCCQSHCATCSASNSQVAEKFYKWKVSARTGCIGS